MKTPANTRLHNKLSQRGDSEGKTTKKGILAGRSEVPPTEVGGFLFAWLCYSDFVGAAAHPRTEVRGFRRAAVAIRMCQIRQLNKQLQILDVIRRFPEELRKKELVEDVINRAFDLAEEEDRKEEPDVYR